MILVAAVLAGIGLACTIYRRTLLGLILGLQILVISVTLVFILAGAQAQATTLHGQIAGLVVMLTGLVLCVAGCALSVRLFYLRQRASLDDVRALKH